MSRIGVVGKGVIGLSVAMKFLREGHAVDVVADAQSFPATSPIAAAFWNPYACSLPIDYEKQLAAPTYQFLSECAQAPALCQATGVEIRSGRTYFDAFVDAHEMQTPWWASLNTQWKSLESDAIPEHLRKPSTMGPIVAGWAFELPVIRIPLFLSWQEDQVRALGGRILVQRATSLQDLCDRYDAVVNCAGGWSTHLVPDPSMVAYQGTVVEFEGEPLGDKLLFLDKADCPSLPTYVVPQRVRTIVGGTFKQITEPGESWKTGEAGIAEQWTPHAEDIDSILDRCSVLCDVDRATLQRTIRRTARGLRPVRIDAPPCIELDTRFSKPVIHNFGHGGSGVTFFWGSALKAFDLFATHASAVLKDR